MGLNSVPREFRDRLRWIPHPPYHIHAARRAVDALIRLDAPLMGDPIKTLTSGGG